MMLRYDVLNEKRRSAMGHRFARGFLPNGGHPLVLFRWKLGRTAAFLNVPDYCPVGMIGVTVRCSQ